MEMVASESSYRNNNNIIKTLIDFPYLTITVIIIIFFIKLVAVLLMFPTIIILVIFLTVLIMITMIIKMIMVTITIIIVNHHSNFF